MMADLPHTLFLDDKKKVTKRDIDEATRLQLEANERSRKRREQKERESYTIEDIFSGKADMDSEKEKE